MSELISVRESCDKWAAERITEQAKKIGEQERDIAELVEALMGLRGCIDSTLGTDAREALEVADTTIAKNAEEKYGFHENHGTR